METVATVDKIVVLKQGRMVEEGHHAELVEKKREYFNLIKNQLELGD